MNKKFLFGLFATLLLSVGCDYNEENFPGFDDIVVTDVAKYEGDFTGKYPAEGYFVGNAAVESAVADMLEDIYPYSDKGSTAKVNVLVGTVIEAEFGKADNEYTLTKEDYDAMGEEKGQPGAYNNFDKNMDVDAYLLEFLNNHYSDLATGKTITISYVFYSGGTSTLTKTYVRTASGWDAFELEAFVADMDYTLATEDYDSMGTEYGTPGRYDNFDSNMDVDFYLPIFLKGLYPYTEAGTTCAVTYKYYSGGTSDKTAIYKYDGTTWAPFNPYQDVTEVTTKIAEMSFDGTAWKLNRLVGGSMKIAFVTEDYEALVAWVLENKIEYKSTKYDNEEYYFGASSYYGNINNAYNTWKSYYNVGGEYTGKSDEEIQAIMDERLAWGIANIVLPLHVTAPDPGLSYIVTYTIYGGRGSGTYGMSFMYNTETSSYDWVAGPTLQ